MATRPENSRGSSAEGSGEVCTHLAWDSEFFGLRIARLNCSRLDEATVAAALGWCAAQRVDCLYFLADSEHAKTLSLAEHHGFQLTDIRMTFEQNPVSPASRTDDSGSIRMAREDDLPALREIAGRTHRDTRFYFDPHFDRAKCDRLYETWIENSYRGYAQAVLVAEAENVPAAYLTCHRKGSETQIGLLGVSQAHQGKGFGTQLVTRFLDWSYEQKATRASVVTQGRNLAAQRLYQRNGFVTASVQLWYHRWFTG